MRRPRAALLAVAMLAGCAPVWRDTAVPMTTVATLDLARFAGRWYEVARFPVIFQEGCTATTADYALRADGRLSVVNSCRSGTTDGPLRRISGEARATGPGQLSVRLGAVPFAAPYWVLWVAPDYGTAVVGVPSGRAGWVLHRSPDIPPARLEAARAILAANGYDTDRLILTPH
jgi:apolipoprotein D and lipocalin family protein